MKYGYLDSKSGQIELDYHAAGDVWLNENNRKEISIPIYKTFRFVGYRASLRKFFLEYPEATMNSVTEFLYVRIGEESNMTAEVRDVVAQAALAIFGPVSAVVHTVGAVKSAGQVLTTAANFDAKQVIVDTPSKAYRLFDRVFNRRVIVDLNSLTSPKFNEFDCLLKLPKRVRFMSLAGVVQSMGGSWAEPGRD